MQLLTLRSQDQKTKTWQPVGENVHFTQLWKWPYAPFYPPVDLKWWQNHEQHIIIDKWRQGGHSITTPQSKHGMLTMK